MNQTANDSTSLSGESAIGAGFVCSIASITYFFLTENAQVRIAPEPPSSVKKPLRFHDRLAWRMNWKLCMICTE